MTMPLKKDESGQYPAYAWPGGYPIYYLDGSNCILCPKCANATAENVMPEFRAAACGIHFEGAPLICEDCNAQIESAYGDPENSEAETNQ